MPTRRQFIKVGIAGAALLAAARYLDRPLAATTAYRVLDPGATRIVRALVPVVLAGALPADGAARARALDETVAAFDRAISGLAPAVREELVQLFSFLNFAPTRVAFAGFWAPFDEVPAGEIRAFLTRWRHSRFDLQRQGYEALTQLIQAAWYGNTDSWSVIGYPGPPALQAV